MNKRIEMSEDEWYLEGVKRFGDDTLNWRFVCPSCGHVQTPEDFRQYKDLGATPSSAGLVCIGRYDGHMDVHMCSGKSPCNYTSRGMLNICPVTIVRENGSCLDVFGFADAAR